MTKKFTAETEPNYNVLETSDGFEFSREMKAKLLEMQFNSASKGNAEILKWLGQQYLGQSVNKTEQVSGDCPLVFCYEDGKDCPVHKYLEHIGEFGTERYKKYMRDNYAKEE